MLMQEGSPNGYVQTLVSSQCSVHESVSRSQDERKALGRAAPACSTAMAAEGTPLTGAKSEGSLPKGSDNCLPMGL